MTLQLISLEEYSKPQPHIVLRVITYKETVYLLLSAPVVSGLSAAIYTIASMYQQPTPLPQAY